MYYNEFQGDKLSGLGFGMMRLPCREDGTIDQECLNQMVDVAIEHGVNYFDTAWPYHAGRSEFATGKALSRYPRESYYLADKFPGHQIMEQYDTADIFDQQLKKCGVEYFDYYLMHNVCEKSMPVYLDPQWSIIEYFIEQRRQGRIRHLGFSSHARIDALRDFLDRYGDQMEFCQLQVNYLDWSLQNAKAKYDLLTERGIPVWVMEPVRGGKLARLPAEEEAKLKALHPEESTASWAMHWLQGLPNVKMILSGMSDMVQMEDNVKSFAQRSPTTAQENELLYEIARKISTAVPCTACRYCCDGCPMELNIPELIRIYNDITFVASYSIPLSLASVPADKMPSACLDCGQCSAMCPQGIDVPKTLRELAQKLDAMPKWADICHQRDLDAAECRVE